MGTGSFRGDVRLWRPSYWSTASVRAKTVRTPTCGDGTLACPLAI